MFISKLALHSFRNYQEKEFTFAPGMTLITGENGLGKSNLLEGIFFASTGHSPLCSRDKDMIKWSADKFVLRISGELKGAEHPHVQSVQMNLRGQKKVKVNEDESTRLAHLLGHFGVVFFLPSDIEIINGGPGLRRQFLDGLICQFSEKYLDNLRKYKRVLKQRNSLLKTPEKYSQSVKEVLTEQLIEYGSEVSVQRNQFLENFSTVVKGFYEEISEKQNVFSLKYLSNVSNSLGSLEKFKSDFVQRMDDVREAEKFQKMTLIGPHRDNLLLLLQDKLASDFGSQGQKRLIALSLKLASAEALKREFNSPPVLLLDDVFSDLDEQKRIRLGSMVQKGSQIILASSRRNDIPFKTDKVIEILPGSTTNDS